MDKENEIKVKNILKDFEVNFELKKKEKAKQKELNLDELICKAELSHYFFAAASGVVCSLIDLCFSKKYSLTDAQNWGREKTEKFVVNVAKIVGCKSKSLTGAVTYLENKYPYPSDLVTDGFGGGLQHHLRDFSHHYSLFGLIFSIVSQFTGYAYGTDEKGVFNKIALPAESLGQNVFAKLSIGVIKWFFHMASDIAGSSNSTRACKAGSGLPGPIISTIKLLSSSKLFGPDNSQLRRDISTKITKLFNGTAIQDNGVSIKFDFRTELGIFAYQTERMFGVVINQVLIRTFYFLKEFIGELRSFDNTGEIDWKKTVPFKNPTITRMSLVSSGIMTLFDWGRILLFWKHDKSTNHMTSISSVSIPGIGAFFFSVGDEIKYWLLRRKAVKQAMEENELRNKVIAASSQTQVYINKKWVRAEMWRQISREIVKALPQISLSLLLMAGRKY